MLGCHDEPTRLGTLGANNWIYISMKCVILAGGLGTRLGEETTVRPKPLIEVGGRPIIWHIMKCYSRHGINDFVICLGYKGYMLKEFFSNYFLHLADVTMDIASKTTIIPETRSEKWRVTPIKHGENTLTGGRSGARQRVGEGKRVKAR